MRRYISIITQDTETGKFEFMSQTDQGHWVSKDVTEGNFDVIQTREGAWQIVDRPKFVERRKKAREQSIIKTVVANVSKLFRTEIMSNEEFTAVVKEVNDRRGK